ncbi:DUF1828 domain-containing protein [Proteus terrae subsp. cibarius]|uniref:DUF1828 domain-containing protein n=1 Tax=Proteus terrae TaxID=1574161 RepID=UPI001495FBE4|nr:DUF1828 domain-containing protein [Proteus terrae]QKD69730.1 DUF1828 domain-containing protein [Proteus terrae subsp. cibarius]
MTEEQYKTYAKAIVIGRNYSEFTYKHVSLELGIRLNDAGRILNKLHDMGCLTITGKRRNEYSRMFNIYKVKSDSITTLRQQYEREYLENMPVKPKLVPVKKQKTPEKPKCGIKFVDKANVSGMGNPMLMKIDSLLKGVRNELHVMQ